MRRLPVHGPLTIGRHPECVVHVDSDLVSRQHAVVHVFDQSMQVEDVSTNGTYVGNDLLKKQRVIVPYGTPIVVGDVTLSVRQVSQQPATPDPTTGETTTHGDPGAPGNRQRAPTKFEEPTRVPPPPGQLFSEGMGSSAEVSPTKQDDGAGVRREIHRRLLEHLDLAVMDSNSVDDPSMRPKVLGALRRIVDQMRADIPASISTDRLVGELVDEALGLGPLERFLSDPKISEIMVVDPSTIYVEENGRLKLSDARFTDDERVRACIERIVTPLGRRIDESSPLVDARLKDGSRVNAVIPPLALKGSAITIRKFSKTPLTLDKLIGFGAVSPQMGRFLTRSVISKKNIVISGGTGSGKTTLLNVLSGAIPPDERIVTIEDAAELQMAQPHVVGLETRPPNMEGKGEYTIRDLLKNAMRMRPDRVVIGECRGGEALDMLQAMNTGHDGSLTTLHSNTPKEAIARLETLVLMAGVELPVRAIREQIAQSIHVVVQQTRFSDGSRKVSEIAEVVGINDEGVVELMPIFKFIRTGTGPDGEVLGEFQATGYLPSYLDQFIVRGLIKQGEPFL